LEWAAILAAIPRTLSPRRASSGCQPSATSPTSGGDEAQQWTIVWDRVTSSIAYDNPYTFIDREFDLATDDLDWHLVILNYDNGNYSTFFDNVQCFTSFGDPPIPTDGDIYLLSSPYHDRCGGHVSNVQTFSDALTPPQRLYLFDGTPLPPVERIGGLVRTGPGDLNISVTRELFDDEPIVLNSDESEEPIVVSRDETPPPIVVTSEVGEV
jgi:hypothetical protein